jgi:hypothetical protein
MDRRPIILWRLFIAIALLLLSGAKRLHGQALAVLGSNGQQPPSAIPLKPAANSWMLKPTPYLAWNQDIAPSVRAQRDANWDNAAFNKKPLTGPDVDLGNFSSCTGDYDMAWEPSDISIHVPNRAVLTATFAKFRSVLSASEISIYTEITLQVDEVFQDQTGTGHPFKHQNIDLLLYGGTVILRSGQAFSLHTEPCDYSMEPEHKYLLVLSYEPVGDFYHPYDIWDISNGTVQALDQRNQYLAHEGKSALNGLRVEQLDAVLHKLLDGQN